MANSPYLKKLTTQAKWKEKQKALGLCITCNKKATQGVFCDIHAERNRGRRRRQVAKRKREHLCIYCGYPVEKGRVCHNRNECEPVRRVVR